MRIEIVLMALLVAVLGSTADYFSKKFVLTDNLRQLACFAVMQVFTACAWMRLLRMTGTLATASKLCTISYTLTMLFVSQCLFNEAVTAKQWAGIVLGFVSLLLML